MSSGMDDHLSRLPIWIAANAKDQMGTVLVGCHLSISKISTFHTRCLGTVVYFSPVEDNLLQRKALLASVFSSSGYNICLRSL